MSARRQSSTTSLARYARTTSPDTSVRNLDFCNAFWGLGDGGVDVLFARMRGAARTMEELRNFWKERSSIEEDYAKRLAKLAKMPIGKDEIGELRNSIDTLRLETDKQAGYHSQLAQQIRTDLEGQVGAFVSKQQHHKKVYQTAIEKEFKVKQAQEQHTSRAREKYESDCLRINSYTAQSTLVQGKDLDKIHLKLERAQQTVQVNEKDYAQFTRVLQETIQKWEQDWKTFCDVCQDLEEERVEFMKDNMWAYANAVSTVCVSDDESCEKMRLALEQLEPEKDMENFVRDYGTGNAIPEPPMFVNYANTDAPPVSSSRISTRPASFVRSTQRTNRSAPLSFEDEPYEDANRAGVGAGGSGGSSRSPPTDTPSLSRSATQKSTANGVNGHTSTSPSREPQRRHSTASGIVKQPVPPAGDPVDPTVSNTQLVIGDHTWDVDPSKDPQQQKSQQARPSPPGDQDPLVKQMAELTTAAAASGTTRRNTIRRDPPSSSVESRKGTTDSLSTPPSIITASTGGSSAAGAPRDFGTSADAVVGSYPLAQTPSRSASPNPPKAALVTPPPPSIPPSTSNVPVEQIVAGYQRPFPGEARSRANSYVGPPPPPATIPSPSQIQEQQGGNVQRPLSRGGYPGVGTQSLAPRSTSPARGPSPTAVGAVVPHQQPQPFNNNSRGGPSPTATVPLGNNANTLHRGVSMSVQRPVTPNTNPVGIALGPDGRVVHDMMVQPVRQASHYTQQPGPPPPHQPIVQPAQQPPLPQAYGVYPDTSRALTHARSHSQLQQHQQPQQQVVPRSDYTVVPSNAYSGGGYGYAPPPHAGYNDPGYHGPAYPQAPPPPPPSTQATNYVGYPATTAAQTARPVYHQPNQSVGHVGGVMVNTNSTTAMAAPVQRFGTAATGNAVYRPTSPGLSVSTGMGGGMGMGRSPSPAPPRGQPPPPTGTYTDDGRPILFYVKALYDYSATIDEEFDFQAGDIIAVTDTPEDGWWSGELLDDTRRQAGRHVFPSNFVCLF